jgi:hypothetical protein
VAGLEKPYSTGAKQAFEKAKEKLKKWFNK